MINKPKRDKRSLDEGINTCLELQKVVLEELKINGVKMIRELKESIDKSPKIE